jgi:hypothetical protein
MQPKTLIHIYLGEESDWPEMAGEYIDAEPAPGPDVGPKPEEPETKYPTLGACCILFLAALCIASIILSTLFPQAYSNVYNKTLTQQITLELSEHPSSTQLQLYDLPTIKDQEQVTVSASGSIHQAATKAIGLLTFYNGSFTAQTIPAGTVFTGKDGVQVVTESQAVVPAATPTTPPTPGTVSVTAESQVAGEVSNIAASDIDQEYGSVVMAQNLYGFSGGQDTRDIQIVTQDDMKGGEKQLSDLVNGKVEAAANREEKPGEILLPLQCSKTFTANHNAGDQAMDATIRLVGICQPLAYYAPDIARVAQRLLSMPKGYHLISFSAFVMKSATNTQRTVTVQAISYIKQDEPIIKTYRFAGK